MNDNVANYNDYEIEGGGAIASWDGVLVVSGSTISSNRVDESGGGILLVGTTAQILNSLIQNNSTQVGGNPSHRLPGEGGGIAVETNSESNELSNLDLINVTFRGNTNNYSGSPTDNYSGNTYFQSTQTIRVASKPVPPPVVDQHLIGFLTIDDFTQVCQGFQDRQGQPFTAAAPSSTEGGTIVCVAPDNTQESLVTLQQKHDMQGAVQAVCASIYKVKYGNVLARLFNYRDPLSWQCFTNERQLVANVTQAALNTYCQSYYPGSTAMLTGQASSPTAYDWKCVGDSIPYRISMNTVCLDLAGNPRNSDVIGLLNPADFNHPNGWQCWGPS